jgi:hypothetical protein
MENVDISHLGTITIDTVSLAIPVDINNCGPVFPSPIPFSPQYAFAFRGFFTLILISQPFHTRPYVFSSHQYTAERLGTLSSPLKYSMNTFATKSVRPPLHPFR